MEKQNYFLWLRPIRKVFESLKSTYFLLSDPSFSENKIHPVLRLRKTVQKQVRCLHLGEHSQIKSGLLKESEKWEGNVQLISCRFRSLVIIIRILRVIRVKANFSFEFVKCCSFSHDFRMSLESNFLLWLTLNFIRHYGRFVANVTCVGNR